MTSYDRFEFLEIDGQSPSATKPICAEQGTTSRQTTQAGAAIGRRSGSLVVDQIIGKHGCGAGEFNCPAGLDCDEHGNLYIADSYNHRIQKIAPDGNVVVFGSRGTAPGHFLNPQDVVVDRDFIYILEQGNNRLQKITHEGNLDMVVGRHGSHPGEFCSPMGLAVDHLGCFYVADTGNCRVQKLSNGGQPLFALTRTNSGHLHKPQGVDADSQGNCYVADTFSHCVVRFDPSGREVGKFGSFGVHPGEMNEPQDLALDGQGTVYVIEMENNRLQAFGPDGHLLGCCNGCNSNVGGMESPTGIAVGPNGEIYVADTINHRVLRIVWR